MVLINVLFCADICSCSVNLLSISYCNMHKELQTDHGLPVGGDLASGLPDTPWYDGLPSILGWF